MPKGILGKKIGMTQIFNENREIVPVTVIEAGPCKVVQKKVPEVDGYSVVQLGFGEKRERLFNKPLKGHFENANVKPKKYLKEFKVDDIDSYQVGQEIDASIFNVGDSIDVIGISKGKGFSGGIKRHNFSRGPMTHGSKYHRRPGAAGPKGPARIFKGRKMPGHHGRSRVTVQNLEIVKVDSEKNMIAIKGSIPGAKNGLVILKESVKN
ncbi:MAG: 50S ribosomal protein L3 [Clostridiales bacterium]|nr:50S ribosomal protein L3 [Clostridiales bacterium]